MIPRILHFVFLNLGVNPMNPDHQTFVIGWLAKHPGWQVYFWTKDTIPPLVNQKLYDSSECMGIRSDLVRYQVLYEHGGVYFDVDFKCLGSLEPFLDREVLLSWEGEFSPNTSGSLGNAVMGCVPGHPFFKRLLDNQVEYIKTHPGDAVEQTGPNYVTRMYNDWTPKFETIENRRVFFPCHHDEPHETSANYPEAVADHYWAGSWRKKSNVS